MVNRREPLHRPFNILWVGQNDGTYAPRIVLASGSHVDLETVSGVRQTGADWTPLLQNLNMSLTDLRTALQGDGSDNLTALEGFAEGILAQLDITLSALRDAIVGASPNGKTLYDLVQSVQGTQPRDIARWGSTDQSGADLTPLFQNLDIALSALRNALGGESPNDKTLYDLDQAVQGTQPRNITQWGGTAQTGADLTPLFQNLDITLSTLGERLRGSDTKDFTTIESAVSSLLTELQDKLDEGTFTAGLGEVQASPTAYTVLARLKDVRDQLDVDLSTRLAEGTFTNRIGEVQASPTANTVLARLKAIRDQLDVDLSTRLAEGTFTGRIGEVQASPTANTLLDRLKSIYDRLDEPAQVKSKTVTDLLTSQTVNASAESTLGNSAQLDLDGVESLAITVDATYNSSATQGVTVKVFTSYDGTNYDDDIFDSFDPSFSAGSSVQKTVAVDPSARYLKVTVQNKDTGQSATVTVKAVTQK